MNPQAATLVYVAGILALFYLDRDPRGRTSWALWIPTIWLLINASRPISQWLPEGPTIERSEQYLEGSPLDASVFGILVLAAFGVLFRRRRKIGSFIRSNAPILLFLSYCALSTLWSDYSFVAFKRWTKAVGDVAMVFIVLTDPAPAVAVRKFLTRTGFVLLPLSVLFIKYYPDIGRTYNPWTWIPMYGGVTMFKNLLGMTCLVCGLGSVWCFAAAYSDNKNPRRKRHLVAHGAIIGMAIWLFFTADSMTSLSCFAMGTGIIVMTSTRWVKRIPTVVHILVVSVVALSLFALFFDTGGNLVQGLGRDASLTGRTAIWAAALAQVKNPILGTGFESFWLGDRLDRIWAAIQENGIQEAHNGYLEVYLNLGWVGVGLLSVVIIAGYRQVIALYRRDSNFGRLMVAFFVVGLVYSLTEAGFRMMSPVWIAFVLAVLSMPKTTSRSVKPRVHVEPAIHSTPELRLPVQGFAQCI